VFVFPEISFRTKSSLTITHIFGMLIHHDTVYVKVDGQRHDLNSMSHEEYKNLETVVLGRSTMAKTRPELEIGNK